MMQIALLILAVLLCAVTPIIGEKLNDRFDTRTIQAFRRQLFLSSNHPNYGGFQPVEGWLVTSSDGSRLALRMLYNDSGKVHIYTPTIGERIYPRRDLLVPFAEVTEISEIQS